MYANMYNVDKQEYTFFINGRPEVIGVGDLRFPMIEEVMDKYYQGEFSEDDEENSLIAEEEIDKVVAKSVAKIIAEHAKEVVESVDFDDLHLTTNADGTIEGYYKGIVLPKVLTNKFMDMYKDGCKNFDMYFKFIDNILKNPRESVRNELYDFLSYESLPINEAGNFIAYKGVRSDLYSVTASNTDSKGNFTTTVLEGTVNTYGRILNSIGATIRVRVTDVCDNRDECCAQGLHVGSYDYASGFGEVTLAVEVNPQDVVSVPTDCSCQKCRVSKYVVKNIVERKYTTPTVDEDEDGSIVETNNEARSDLNGGRHVSSLENEEDIVDDIVNQINKNGGVTTIRQLRGSVGRKHNLTTPDLISICSMHVDIFRMTYNDRGNGFTEIELA